MVPVRYAAVTVIGWVVLLVAGCSNNVPSARPIGSDYTDEDGTVSFGHPEPPKPKPRRNSGTCDDTPLERHMAWQKGGREYERDRRDRHDR